MDEKILGRVVCVKCGKVNSGVIVFGEDRKISVDDSCVFRGAIVHGSEKEHYEHNILIVGRGSGRVTLEPVLVDQKIEDVIVKSVEFTES